ncbi:hypothetical protein LX36DRAFT_119431 [Colletotrichum falcatum]|nr:hypothetical protein LX36DRAFT_119431 [Colletotrichum falcatum]
MTKSMVLFGGLHGGKNVSPFFFLSPERMVRHLSTHRSMSFWPLPIFLGIPASANPCTHIGPSITSPACNHLACPPLGSNELLRGAWRGAHRASARCLILPSSRHSTGTLRQIYLPEDDTRVSRGGYQGGRRRLSWRVPRPRKRAIGLYLTWRSVTSVH